MEDYIEGGTKGAAELQYPWEAEAQAARVVQEEQLEKAVETGWKSSSDAHLEEIRQYGLDYWIYFRLLRALAIVFVAQAMLAAPKLAVLAQGTGIQQRDPLAWLAYISLGNANPGDEVLFMAIPMRVDGSSFLGIFDALQSVILLVFLAWFLVRRLPSFAKDPELRPLTAADYAVQVEGLPRQLPEDHNQYEMEVIRHFEALLRELDGGDPHARVYEAALVRDFGRGLYAAQEAARIEALLHGGMEGDAPRAVLGSRRERQLKARLELMKGAIARARGDEAERSVMRAYVICSSQKERSDILREYRFTRLPVVGRCFQRSHMRFHGRWPLRVSAAPEPGDIHWGYFGLSGMMRARGQAATMLFAVLVLIGGAGLSWLCWWSLLGMRGQSAAQCSIGFLSEAQNPNADAAFCLLPPARDDDNQGAVAAGEPGCDCICANSGLWWTDASECYTFGAMEACGAVLICVVLTECAQRLLLRVLPSFINRWHPVDGADVECAVTSVIAAALCFVPLTASIGHFILKVGFSFADTPGLAKPLIWELDRGWYLHAAPVILIWCLLRWLGSPALALVFCCRAKRVKKVMVLSERYATLASVVVVSIVFQPLLPCLAPIAMIGLFLRYWLEKSAFLSGRLERKAAVPFRTTKRVVRIAMTFIWAGVVGGSALAVWVLGEPVVAGASPDSQAEFLSRALTSTAAPAFVVLCLSLSAPVLLYVFLALHRLLCEAKPNDGGREGGKMNYQEAWLIMTHNGQIATYQLHDQPGDRGASLLDSLQSWDNKGIDRDQQHTGAPSYLSREGDVTPSLAVVGAKAPTRGGKPMYLPPQVKPSQAGAQQNVDIFNQLRTAAVVAPAATPVGRGRAGRMQAAGVGPSGGMV